MNAIVLVAYSRKDCIDDVWYCEARSFFLDPLCKVCISVWVGVAFHRP